MALFANLSDLNNDRIAYLQFVTDADLGQINTARDDILSKGTFFKRRQNLLYQINTLGGKQGDLSVPVSTMRVTFYTPVLPEQNRGLLFFNNSLFLTCTDCFHLCHDLTTRLPGLNFSPGSRTI